MSESKACLGHHQTSVMELLFKNVNCWKLFTIFAKKLHHRYLTGFSTSLRLYFHSLLILKIILDLEFQILEFDFLRSITCKYNNGKIDILTNRKLIWINWKVWTCSLKVKMIEPYSVWQDNFKGSIWKMSSKYHQSVENCNHLQVSINCVVQLIDFN